MWILCSTAQNQLSIWSGYSLKLLETLIRCVLTVWVWITRAYFTYHFNRFSNHGPQYFWLEKKTLVGLKFYFFFFRSCPASLEAGLTKAVLDEAKIQYLQTSNGNGVGSSNLSLSPSGNNNGGEISSLEQAVAISTGAINSSSSSNNHSQGAAAGGGLQQQQQQSKGGENGQHHANIVGIMCKWA